MSNLVCGICNDILDNPMQVHCSEDHMFCRRCINNYEKPSCPSCMEPLDKTGFQLSKFVKRQISRLRVRCIYKPLGCSWEGVLEDNHSASCNYQSIPCPNTHRGCTEKIGIMEIDRHRLECSYELLACPNNAQKCKPYLRKDIHIHNAQCSSFRCHFAHEGCIFTGTLVDVNQHVENYCGKLHGRIRELELQCQQLKQQLNQQQQQQQDVINSTINMPQQVDTSMDEMTLFHQMFNNGFLGMSSDNTNTATTLNDNNNNTPTISTTNSNTTATIENNMNIDPNTNLMNLTNLPTIPLLTSTPSSDMNKDQMIIPDNSKDISSTNLMTAPKRSTNGKIIRYSKNKQLAHGALRMARQRTSSNGGLTTDAILNALHVATTAKSIDDEDINMKGSDINLHPNITNSSLNNINPNNNNNTNNHKNNLINKQKQQQPSSRNTSNRANNNSNNNNNNKTMDGSNKEIFAFKSLDDVTKFLEELPPIVEATPFLSPQHGKKPITKHKSNSDRTNKSKMNNDTSNITNTRRQSKPSSSPSSSSPFNNSNNNINSNDSHLNDVSHLSTPPSLPGTPMEVTGNVASPPSTATSNTTPLRPMFVLASSFLSKSSQDPSVN
ncbi:unnamed protein product [Cunninghamella echinulata]